MQFPPPRYEEEYLDIAEENTCVVIAKQSYIINYYQSFSFSITQCRKSTYMYNYNGIWRREHSSAKLTNIRINWLLLLIYIINPTGLILVINIIRSGSYDCQENNYSLFNRSLLLCDQILWRKCLSTETQLNFNAPIDAVFSFQGIVLFLFLWKANDPWMPKRKLFAARQ